MQKGWHSEANGFAASELRTYRLDWTWFSGDPSFVPEQAAEIK